MLFLRRGYAGLVALSLFSAAHAQPPAVRYDEAHDRVTVSGNDTTLMELARRLAEATATDIRFDPAMAGERMTVQIDAWPLDRALLGMFRGYSHIIQYRNRGDQPRIASITLLPKGDGQAPAMPSAVPVAAPEQITMAGDRWDWTPDQPDNVEVAANHDRTPVVPPVRFLDDLSPADLAQLSDEEREALPARPVKPANPNQAQLPQRGSFQTGNSPVADM